MHFVKRKMQCRNCEKTKAKLPVTSDGFSWPAMLTGVGVGGLGSSLVWYERLKKENAKLVEENTAKYTQLLNEREKYDSDPELYKQKLEKLEAGKTEIQNNMAKN